MSGRGKNNAKSGSRLRKASRAQKRKYDKQSVKKYKPVPKSLAITHQVFVLFKENLKVFFGLAAIYMLTDILFASGLANLSSAYASVKDGIASSPHSFLNSLGGFSALFSSVSAGASGSSGNPAAKSIIILIQSLVIIWTLRHLLSGKSVKVKDAYYSATGPLIPFIVVVFILIIQFLPLTIGTTAAVLVSSALAGSGWFVDVLIFAVAFMLGVWSIYMISGSAFALYIVTLPKMKPFEALRSAKNLVRFRRWTIIKRFLFLPFFIFFGLAIIMVPLMMWAGFLVTPVFYILFSLAIIFFHGYLYCLYRGLLE